MFFYQQGDVIDNFYFGIKGTSAFVIPQDQYRIFGVIDPEKSLVLTKHRRQIQQYFGIEDAVVNATALVHDDSVNFKEPKKFLFKKNGFKMANRRYFTVQCIVNTEVLTLTSNDLDRMKRDYPYSTKSLFLIMMKQTKTLLQFQLNVQI